MWCPTTADPVNTVWAAARTRARKITAWWFQQDLSAQTQPPHFGSVVMDTIAPLWLWIFFVASVLVALFVGVLG